jgi:hypothetical protein
MTRQTRPIPEGKLCRQSLHSRLRGKPSTYFNSYNARLAALSERHGVPVAHFKLLIERAFGTPQFKPNEEEAREALWQLAKMGCGPCELNWLFQYHIVIERLP